MLGILSFWYGGNPPEITAAIALLAWWSIALGLATGLLPLERLGRPAVISIGLFLLLTLLTAASISWALDGGRALTKTVQIVSLLGAFSLCLLCSRCGDARGWLAGISIGMAILVLLGLFSRLTQAFGDDVELSTNLSGVAGRLSWPFGYWNALGACAAMTLVSLTWFAARAWGRNWRLAAVAAMPAIWLTIYLTSSRGAMAALFIGLVVLFALGPQRRRLAAGLACGLLPGAILIVVASGMPELAHAEFGSVSESQGRLLILLTLLAGGAAAFAWSLLDGRLEHLGPWRPAGWLIAIVLAVAAVGLVAADPVAQVREFTAVPSFEGGDVEENTTTAHLLSVGGNGRWQFWTSAFDAFKGEPLHGIGAGSYQDFYAEHRDTPMIARHSHSLPLQFLAELGLIGAIVALGFLVFIVYTAIRRWQEAALDRVPSRLRRALSSRDRAWPLIAPLLAVGAAGLTSMSVDWTGEFPAISIPVLVAFACLVGPSTLSAGRQSAGSELPSLAAVAAILVAGAAIWVSATGFGFATQLNASREAVAEDDLKGAAEHARKAIDLEPGAAEARVQLALVEELMGRDKAALAAINAGVERAPNNSSYHLLRSRILLRLGRERQAQQAYERARSLDPRGAFFIEE